MSKSFPQIIVEKQKQYYKLQKELSQMIEDVIGIDVSHNERPGIIHIIYKDSTADVSFLNEETGKEYMENVKMTELTFGC